MGGRCAAPRDLQRVSGPEGGARCASPPAPPADPASEGLGFFRWSGRAAPHCIAGLAGQSLARTPIAHLPLASAAGAPVAAAAAGTVAAEKTLKKVQEGLEIFDEHQEQYDTTDPSNTNAREKLESQVRCQQLAAACAPAKRAAKARSSTSCTRGVTLGLGGLAALGPHFSCPYISIPTMYSSRIKSRSCSGCATPSRPGAHRAGGAWQGGGPVSCWASEEGREWSLSGPPSCPAAGQHHFARLCRLALQLPLPLAHVCIGPRPSASPPVPPLSLVCLCRMTSSEIKDKTDITNARKEIERRMERFKLVEKEAKTKSFSKEGLNRAAADPKERARAEMRDWLTSTVDTLNTQVSRASGQAGRLVDSLGCLAG